MTIALIFAESLPHETTWQTIVKQPALAIVVLSLYLYIVRYRGPKWMKDRDAFNLRTFMIAYNFAQIWLSVYVVYFLTSMTIKQTGSVFSCIIGGEFTYRAHCFALLTKYTELIETFIFVLRKKQSQVSFLHTYHHCMVIIMGTLGIYIEPGGPPMLYAIINGYVHIVMYLYYFLTILQPEKQAYYARFKPRITEMQLVQFVITTVHFMRNVLGYCPGSMFMAVLSVLQNFVFIVLFSKFYIRTYLRKNVIKAKTS